MVGGGVVLGGVVVAGGVVGGSAGGAAVVAGSGDGGVVVAGAVVGGGVVGGWVVGGADVAGAVVGGTVTGSAPRDCGDPELVPGPPGVPAWSGPTVVGDAAGVVVSGPAGMIGCVVAGAVVAGGADVAGEVTGAGAGSVTFLGGVPTGWVVGGEVTTTVVTGVVVAPSCRESDHGVSADGAAPAAAAAIPSATTPAASPYPDLNIRLVAVLSEPAPIAISSPFAHPVVDATR